MKKLIAIISILFLLMGCTSVYATSQVNEVAQSTTGKIIEIKDKELKTLEEYKEAYGSDAYGLTAFLLNKIRVYSIPFGFVAIIIAAIYQMEYYKLLFYLIKTLLMHTHQNHTLFVF